MPLFISAAQLNHYSFRSQQDYEEKIIRGDAIYTEINPRGLEKFYAQTRRPTVVDTFALRFVPQVKDFLERGKKGRDSQFFPQVGRFEAVQKEKKIPFAFTLPAGEKDDVALRETIAAFLAKGDYAAAEATALYLAAVFPNLHSHRELFFVYLTAYESEKAKKIGILLYLAASYGRESGFLRELEQQAWNAGMDLQREVALMRFEG